MTHAPGPNMPRRRAHGRFANPSQADAAIQAAAPLQDSVKMLYA